MRGTKAKRLRRIVYGDRVAGAKGRTYAVGKSGGAEVVERERREYRWLKRGLWMGSLLMKRWGWTLSADVRISGRRLARFRDRRPGVVPTQSAVEATR